ncbi:hypothetical protein QQS21_005432 [Conoideocrella luteorostrata]|uniref:DUF924 domain-containing protein n=1 Tax=Conoideocrella luteorostrata TaxID=1105319 RepID=A0AAJ0FZ05_9HYPO|nr:hypothetical protein QQS21_005432 [Conoideocrella luteorostrata]
MNNPEVKRVVAFWFNRPPLEWIIAPEGLDVQLKSDFGDLVLSARRNELDSWADEAEPCVALVALLDQFSRNMFRGSPEAFSADARAWDIATKAISRGFEKKLLCLFEALKPRCESDEEHKWVDMGISASKRHMQQLERFGRYPTRNAALGRKSTETEEEYLEQRVSSL